ncbi:MULTISPECIES: hypothetical protein [Providencia]|uniref:hypothetical protein n=1 Tax=Providencia TaxID=586 RepID=UPI000838DC4F|nr:MULTISPECIES: hypothetical protein [Providencia]MCX9110633.1 hypothetical protein [Providencia rettgeri]NIH22145.1 hypothetical protein [Providencia heimbachae]
MSEFKNRIIMQRDIIKLINSSIKVKEPILSLTNDSIKRWSSQNGINENENIISLLLSISNKLGFLANKSQEQLSDDYTNLSSSISEKKNILEKEIIRYKNK